MAIPSIHNLLARLDSTFVKESPDTNFYQLLQMVAHELDEARRELEYTKRDNYFFQVRDDQLFANLGVLMHVNKQPFHTKKQILSTPLAITIEEDLDTRPQCLNEALVKVTVEWETEIETSSEIEYTTTSPYIVPEESDPTTQLFDVINEGVLNRVMSNPGTKHKVVIPGLQADSDLWFRIRTVNVVNEVRQSEFIYLRLPEFPLLTPIFTTEDAIIQDEAGRTIRVPLEDDPFGYRQYRKILYGVLTSFLTGPTQKGVEAGIQPFFDLPVEVVENFPSIPDLNETGAIQVEHEILVHTFRVNVILSNDSEQLRNLGEINEQVREVLDLVKPAHTLPDFGFVQPDHFFCPTDNPFGVKQSALALEPTIGPCGEKVFINPIPVDLGVTSYYQDVLGYRIYCEYEANYFGTYCPYLNNPYQYEINTSLNGYFDVLDRNYFYMDNGERLVLCPFVKNREVELVIEHRNGTDPDFIEITGDVDASANTFTDIPYSTPIRVNLTEGNGPKIVTITFKYPPQAKTNDQEFTNTGLTGPVCHGDVSVDAVTYLLNTIPDECCVEEYVLDTCVIDAEMVATEDCVLQSSFCFRTNEETSVLNGPHGLCDAAIDEVFRGQNFDACLFTNLHNRTLNDPEIVLCSDCPPALAEIEIDILECDSTRNDILVLNNCETDICGRFGSVLNRSTIICAENEFLCNSGTVVARMMELDRAFYTNGDPIFDPGDDPFFQTSVMNDANGAVVSPVRVFNVEPWNPFFSDMSACEIVQEEIPAECI